MSSRALEYLLSHISGLDIAAKKAEADGTLDRGVDFSPLTLESMCMKFDIRLEELRILRDIAKEARILVQKYPNEDSLDHLFIALQRLDKYESFHKKDKNLPKKITIDSM